MFAIEVMVLIILGLIWIVFASIEDLKTKEVADWLNFSLIIFALGFRFFWSLFASENFMFFYQGLAGLGIFFILGNLFYYSRMFAGGDAKLMIALGPILAFSESFAVNVKIFASFIFVFFFIGAVYGLVGSFVLMTKNWREFKKEFKKQFNKFRSRAFLTMVLGLVLMIGGFVILEFLFFGVFVFLLPLLFVFAKAVDLAGMVKEIPASQLREGDWIFKGIKIGEKMIKSKWDGVNREEVELIKRYRKKIKIREGIPFVPVFLFSYLVLLFLIETDFWKLF